VFSFSEATIPGVVVAGPIPAPLHDYTNYDAAVLAGAANKELAAGFLKYVTGKPAAATWKAANIDAMGRTPIGRDRPGDADRVFAPATRWRLLVAGFGRVPKRFDRPEGQDDLAWLRSHWPSRRIDRVLDA
jgi:hypothetical protein